MLTRRGRESVVNPAAFQDLLPHNHCFGCGPNNPGGLRIKSFWTGPDVSVAKFTPHTHHCAGPTHFVNGGIIATVIDCHCVCTAAAAAYRDAAREIGSRPDVYFATAKLELQYMRPTPIDAELIIQARIEARTERTYVLSCQLEADGKPRVKAQVEAIQVPASWMLDNAAAM